MESLYFLKAVYRFATATVQDGFHQTGDDDGYFLEDFCKGYVNSGGLEYERDSTLERVVTHGRGRLARRHVVAHVQLRRVSG